MTGFLAQVNNVFDLLLRPFRCVHPIYALALLSLLTTLLALLVFRYGSNQRALRRAKDRLEAHVLEVRLFQDQLRVVLRAYARLLGGVLIYLRHSLRPLALLALPLLIILIQLESYFGHAPVQIGNNFIVKARIAGNASLDEVSLRLPNGLKLTSPALRIAEQREIDWRIQADRPGQCAVDVLVAGEAFTKQIIVGEGLSRVLPARMRTNLVEQFLHPGEAQLPDAGPLESIEIQYKPRNVRLGGFDLHWLVPFLVITLLGAFALKGVFRTEI
jgi:hypothetical protein